MNLCEGSGGEKKRHETGKTGYIHWGYCRGVSLSSAAVWAQRRHKCTEAQIHKRCGNVKRTHKTSKGGWRKVRERNDTQQKKKGVQSIKGSTQNEKMRKERERRATGKEIRHRSSSVTETAVKTISKTHAQMGMHTDTHTGDRKWNGIVEKCNIVSTNTHMHTCFTCLTHSAPSPGWKNKPQDSQVEPLIGREAV